MATPHRVPDGFTRSTRDDGAPRVLAVVLHGWCGSAARMSQVTGAVEAAFRGEAALDVLAPDLPHRRAWSLARAADTVMLVVRAIDALVEAHGPYDKILLIGHSLGATLARRVFLVAAGPIAGGAFRAESPFAGEPARSWADRVERIVLIAAFNRGWQISKRLSWYYSIGFNIIGFLGHVASRMPGALDLTPTIFDIRLGAPFITQTRLNWMAYRRQSARTRQQPLLIQLIGTEDDLISPFDQVDIAVDGLEHDLSAPPLGPHAPALARRRAENKTNRSYFLLKMPYTGHESAIDFEGALGATPDQDRRNQEVAAARKAVLTAALTFLPAGLDSIASDPDLLADQVERPDSAVKRTVFVIHGIRDDGFWTHRIAERVRSKAVYRIAFRAWTPSYGYFAMLPFLVPWIRQRKVEWFMDQYASACAQYPEARFDFIGHSNGTYLGAEALAEYPDCHFGHVYFAGSVVRRDYGWAALVDSGRIEGLLNAVATNDRVVALLPKSLEWWPRLKLGGAGFDGFDEAGSRPGLIETKYVAGGHGAGIAEGHWDAIADYIVAGEAMIPNFKRPDLFQRRQDPGLRRLADLRIGLPLLALLIVVALPAALCLLIRAAHHHHAPGSSYLLGLLLYLLAVAFLVNRL